MVFEVLSKETWNKDLAEKPAVYGRLGVQEYFVYDPNVPPLARATARRLFGWQRDPLSGRMALIPSADGSLWSEELDSFLVPDKQLLRLTDRQLRLTEAETEAAARQAAERRAQALAEKLRSLGVDPDQL